MGLLHNVSRSTMCSFPGCMTQNFELRGPIAAPPLGGWRIKTLPKEAAHLQSAWDKHVSHPVNAKSARWHVFEFLGANDIPWGPVENEVYSISYLQWCSPEPRRCKGYRPNEAPNLPWAKALWESANFELKDGLTDQQAKDILDGIVDTLTAAINSPDGCPRCANHWETRLASVPVPEHLTLDEARHWLVDAHNFTREGKPPTAYDLVAIQFNWTSN